MERSMSWMGATDNSGIPTVRPERNRTLTAGEVEELLRDLDTQMVSFRPEKRLHAKTA